MQYLSKTLFTAVMILLFITCKEQQKESTGAEAPQTTTQKIESTISIQDAWVANRVKKAKERLTQTEAGKVVWASMEAHGGLDTWYKNGPLGMRFNYQPLDGKTPRDSYEVVDTWNNRVVHTSIEDPESKFGFTGEETWLKAKDSTTFNYDVKFWALTPLYLMGHPFVEDGQGVNLELLPETTYKGKKNKLVKVTYEPGTGDAPDDYYILHFDAETNLLTATRYIVSYPAYFKDGGHNPEKFMEVGELVDVDGVLLPTELKTHWTLDGKPGEYITKIEISELEFKSDLPTNFFDIPVGAKKL